MATSSVPARATELLRVVLNSERRHPLLPAAVRVERSTARNEKGHARQTAITLWFAQGPALPGPASAGPSARAVAGTVAGVVGVVALGALGVLAAQRQPRVLTAEPREQPPRLLQPSTSDESPEPLEASDPSAPPEPDEPPSVQA